MIHDPDFMRRDGMVWWACTCGADGEAGSLGVAAFEWVGHVRRADAADEVSRIGVEQEALECSIGQETAQGAMVTRAIRNMVTEVARFDRAYGGVYDWAEDDFPGTTDPYDLDALLLEAQRVQRAARIVEQRIKEAFQQEVQLNGAVRVGGTVYGDKPAKHRVLQDPDGLAEFLGADWRRGLRVDMKNVRIEGVKALAASRGLDAGAIEDSFFAWEGEDGRVLNPLPVDGKYTPKWAKALKEGERRR